MNRLLVLVIGIIAVAVMAMAVVLIAGGGRDTPVVAGLDPTTIGEVTGSESAPVAATGEIDVAAEARFDAWADPLREAGFTITAATVGSDRDTLVLTGLDIAAPSSALGWHWTASAVRIDLAEDGGATATPNGAMTLALADGAEPADWPLTADSIELTSERDEAGAVSSVAISFANMAVGDAETAGQVTAAEALLRSVLGGDSDAAGASNASLHFTELVLPGQSAGPLGSTIQSLDVDVVVADGRSGFGAPWRGGGGSVTLDNIALEWGALHLAGSGALSADALGRPTGQLNVDIANILLTLDAYNAVQRFDRDLMADTYAALLFEMANNPEAETMPFTIAIEDGQIVLQGQSHGIADIVLGTVSPVSTPAVTE